jgi:hypothetical protein
MVFFRVLKVSCVLQEFKFLSQKNVTGSSYLDMLQLYAFPQLEHLQPNVLFNKTVLHPTGR